MAKSAWELGVCEGCTTFAPDGELLMTGAGRCGVSAITVGPIGLKSEYPEVAQSVENCTGPIEREVRRRGLLGSVGFKETITVCPAVSEDQLTTIFNNEVAWHDALHETGDI